MSLRPESDLEYLVHRCRLGDERAWREFVTRHQGLVYSVTKKFHLSEDDAADVFQATFLALYRSIDKIDSPATIPKWLAVTASREAIRLYRKSGQNQLSLDNEALGLSEMISRDEATADELAIATMESVVVHEGLMQLESRCRDLLKFLFVETDVSYNEIATRTGIPVGSIGPTRARCLDKLRSIVSRSSAFTVSE